MVIDPGFATVIGAGLEVGGGLLSNALSRDSSEDLFRMQREAMQNRYAWTARDMERAGLNRVLALGSPSAAPTGAMPTIRNPAAGLASSVKQAAMVNAEVDRLKADADLKTDQSDYYKESQTLVTKQGNKEDAQRDMFLSMERLNNLSSDAKTLEVELGKMRNDFFRKNPVAYESTLLSGGLPERIALGQLGKAIPTDKDGSIDWSRLLFGK